MSYPIPSVDPTEVTYPEDIPYTNGNSDGSTNPDALDDCLDCDGTGFISTPAYQYGGEIIDEVERPCACTLGEID